MSIEHVRQSLHQVTERFARQPGAALSQDRPATATLEGGLRCRAIGPDGASIATDMPKALGGAASAPTPGWFMRAALASCDATVIAMRAAQLGVELSRLEVTVGSESDARGLLGADEEVPAGPLRVHVSVRICAPTASPQQLRDIVRWAEQHSPVGDAIRRCVPTEIEVDAGAGAGAP